MKSEGRAPARAYAIWAREEATSPDVIVGTFCLFDVTVYALIYPGSTHLYICTSLVIEKKMPEEFAEFDVKVSNPLR